MKLELSLAKQILAIISSFINNDCEIILFGSYAKGKASVSSDIDIAIKTKLPLEPATWSLIEEKFEESDIIPRIDLIDYQRVKTAFQQVIDRDGINLKTYVLNP